MVTMMTMMMAMMLIRTTLVMMIMKMTWNRSSLSTGELMLGRALLESNWSIRISGKTGRSSWWNRGKTETGLHQNSHYVDHMGQIFEQYVVHDVDDKRWPWSCQ